MLVSDKAAIDRLSSPLNLMNRMKSVTNGQRKSAMSLFVPPANTKKDNERSKEINEAKAAVFNPFVKNESVTAIAPVVAAETLDTILENNDSQIKLGLAHDGALDLLSSSITALKTKLDEVRADKLPAVIAAASKTVESIRRERHEAAKSGTNKEVHYHFYTPQQRAVSEYQVIDVGSPAEQSA